MDINVDIHLYEASVNIVKKSGDALCEILNNKFKCVATIEGVEVKKERSTNKQRQAQTSLEQRGQFTLRSGVKVSVWKADLRYFSADAVVNAANEHLQHIGGLAYALMSAGGSQIQTESDDFVRTHGPVKSGDTVVLNPGSLPCKKIIHAVGPELSMNPHKREVEAAKPVLESVIKSILNRVGEHHMATVAIPAISSGLFHYPLPECAHTIVTAIKSYYDNPHRTTPQEIFLVNNDEPTVQEMKRACHQIFSPHQHQPYSHSAASNTGSASKNPPSLQIGNVTVTLKKGNIEEQQTDVIVNTASIDFDLRKGAISNAILKKAGDEMNRAMATAKWVNSIAITKPYKLFCKEVYHTFCIEKCNFNAETVLYNSVYECLMQAAKSFNSSVAFPAIGTGMLKFSGRDSATIMLKAVVNFARNFPNNIHVFIVIFPVEDEIFQAFETEIRSHTQKGPQPSFGHASGPKEDSHTSRALTPKLRLHCPSDESKREAMKWLNDRLFTPSSAIKIYDNFISHISRENYQRLALLGENGSTIREFFSQGQAYIELTGNTGEDAAIAALQVEAMLCRIHREFISEGECELKAAGNVSWEKNQMVENKSQEFSARIRLFKPLNLWIEKVEKVENVALQAMFEMKRKQLSCPAPDRMFQRIPAQFCEMISRIGFQAECAPPKDPNYGEGIYFVQKLKTALELWREEGEEYLYFVEADVLTGHSTKGEPGLILPPPKGKDLNAIYDSVYGEPGVSVIFSGYQALPKYIIVCKNPGFL